MSGEKPVVVTYQADWPARAGRLIGELRASLGALAVRLDHIGSTAVPGMAAKDVLDLQMSVHDLAGAGSVLDAPLAVLGFDRSPHEQDHLPAGRSGDPGDWTKRLWLRRGHREGPANLHVRRAGAPNERLSLLFRDWFRSHPDAVPAYGTFKVVLARMAPDLDAYVEVKDPVVDLVVATAEQWAAAVGWHLWSSGFDLCDAERTHRSEAAVGDDWSRPVVHWEIVARHPERQAAFYRALCHWEIGEGPIMQIPAGLGGPEPGPGGHIRQGDRCGVSLYVQVRDLRSSLDLAVELGGRIVAEPFDVPGGPTLAAVDDPEGVPLVLVQQ